MSTKGRAQRIERTNWLDHTSFLKPFNYKIDPMRFRDRHNRSDLQDVHTRFGAETFERTQIKSNPTEFNSDNKNRNLSQSSNEEDQKLKAVASGGLLPTWSKGKSTSKGMAAAGIQPPVKIIAWGKKVSEEFKKKVIQISQRLSINPSWLMAVMAFETGKTFSPSIRNKAGSGATGLIQFMPKTAIGLGTSTSELAQMTAERQLDYVEKYFQQNKRPLQSLDDVYMVVLYPPAIGKPGGFVLFRQGGLAYKRNSGLDRDRDGTITKAEASEKVRTELRIGLLPQNAG